MADAFYNKLATTAGNLLTKFGATITLTRTTGRTDNPVTGAVVAGTETTYSPKGIVLEYDDALYNGSRIVQGDRRLVLDDTVAPLMTDELTIAGELWKIIAIEDKTPAGVPLVYSLQVRR